MIAQTPEDLFELMSRWDVEAKEIPSYLARTELAPSKRRALLVRRVTLIRAIKELRDAMATMRVHYRGLVNGVVIITANTEEECWAKVGDEGTVEFELCTHWALTDSAIEHEK